MRLIYALLSVVAIIKCHSETLRVKSKNIQCQVHFYLVTRFYGLAKLPKMFPMCASMKQLINQKQNEHSFSLSKFALRVASQETKSRWIRKSKEDWNLHEKNTFYRGIVECLAMEGTILID